MYPKQIKYNRLIASFKFTHILLLFTIIISPVRAVESWPSEQEWVPVLNAYWDPILDPSDIRQGHIDIVTDQNGYGSYFSSSETSLFFRLALRKTPLKSTNNLQQMAWFVAIDADLDNLPDWDIMVGGISEALYAHYNQGSDTDPETINYQVDNPLATGDVRLVSGSYSVYPDLTYLDLQIPYTALTATGYNRNVNAETPVKLAFSTSTTESVAIKDALGPSATITGVLANSIITTIGDNNTEVLGFLYDTRDLNPSSDEGIWKRGETVSVSGFGWPVSGSSYFNSGIRNVRIINSDANTVWIGTITTTSTGEINDAATWIIDNYTVAGLYTIQVEDPTAPSIWHYYDTFTIIAPDISITKTASNDTVNSGDTLTYQISITNNGNTAGYISSVIDDLPQGFSYIQGSANGLTSTDPIINGQQLNWSGNWFINEAGQPGNSVILNFNSQAGTTRGLFTNNASTGGINFGIKSVTNTAPVYILAPLLTLYKTVSSPTTEPGEILTYTIIYTNTGDGPAGYIFILENIPDHSTYIEDSATGDNMTVTYSHDNGVTYDSDQTQTVTNLAFQRTLTLPAGQSGSISFQVIIK